MAQSGDSTIIDEQKLLDKKTCPICGGDSHLVDNVLTIHPDSKRKVELRECIICTHWWHTKMPTQELLDEFYSTGSEYVVPKHYTDATVNTSPDDYRLWEHIFKTAAQHSKKINKTGKTFNYLEVGVGSGKLFSFFKEKANIAYGVEPGEWVAVSDKNTIVSDVKYIPQEIKFDLIIAHDVLEHVSDPTKMLKTLWQAAGPDCVLHVTFPNKDALKAKIQKGSWHMVRPFGHLHYFSKRSVEEMFKNSGWSTTELKPTRISEMGALDLIQQFKISGGKIVYRLIKSLLVGQILLGKDQWTAIGVKK